jgi:hypothetical protein
VSDYALPRPLPRIPAIADARTLVARAFRLSVRNVDGLITALALPVLLMLMFVYLFGGAIDVGGHYVDYVVPGVLLVCVGFGAATTAVSVAHDLTGGIIDRFRAMDVRGEALINSHVSSRVWRETCCRHCWFSVWPSRSASGPERASPIGSAPYSCSPSSSSRCRGSPPRSGSSPAHRKQRTA